MMVETRKPQERVEFVRLEPKLEIVKVRISPENARHLERETDLDGLEASIQSVGVIQPPIVEEGPGNDYTLIAGQRRLLASKRAGESTIPALVIHDVSPETRRLISFGENVHRRVLHYLDTVRVCSELYDSYSGSPTARARKISKALGIHPTTVARYLRQRLVPDPVKQLVSKKKLSMPMAERITTYFSPDADKITAIARAWPELTNPEKERALELGIKKPKSPAEELLAEARKARDRVSITIYVEPETHGLLAAQAEARNMPDVPALVRYLVDRFLAGGMQE